MVERSFRQAATKKTPRLAEAVTSKWAGIPALVLRPANMFPYVGQDASCWRFFQSAWTR